MLERERTMDRSDKVWYACYGSNLKAKRFKCYIVGGYCPCNDKHYRGCTDKTLWADSKVGRFNGELYFGNESESFESLFHSETGYSIYPNPASTAIVVNGLEAPTTLRLYSLEGQLIKSAVGTSINVTDIPDGNYLLQCENQVLRVIKQ